MGNRALPKEEIQKRLIRLRNLEFLHEQQRFKIWGLRDENRELKKEIKALKITVGEQQKTIDDLKLQMEELRMMRKTYPFLPRKLSNGISLKKATAQHVK